MPWPQTGEIQYYTQLGLQDKGRAIKELVVYGPGKRPDPRLLSTVPEV